MKLHIIIIVEEGVLEQQALLAIKSILTFVQPHLDCKIWAVSPRGSNYHPKKSTTDFFKNNNITYLNKYLNIRYDYFPLCNGIYASEHIESKAQNSDFILLIDTDTLFINPIDRSFFDVNSVYLRPVDNKGIGSTGNADSNDVFWQDAFNLFGLKPDFPEMKTTVDQQTIRPYYNSGFVLAPKSFNFFRKWKTVFENLMGSQIRTNPSQSRHKVDFGFLEQMSISVALSLYNLEKKMLPNSYNYPLPFMPVLSQRDGAINFSNLCHIHYHRWFQHPGFLNHILNDDDMLSAQYQWLQPNLPLTPIIKDSFKR